MRRVPLATLVFALGGCGRIAFDPTGNGDASGGGDVAGGGSDAPGGIQPIHRYPLNGNYNDDFGGPPLVPHGGSLVAGGYQFAANQGPSVDNALPPNVYTVDMVFSFTDMTSWRKILDFKGLAQDSGFYTYEFALQYVIVPQADFLTGAATLTVNVPMRITLTRDAAAHVTGYIARASVPADRSTVEAPPTAPSGTFAFDDTAGVAALTGPTATFFADDTTTGQGEASAGTVRSIAIYDVALSAAQIATLP